MHGNTSIAIAVQANQATSALISIKNAHGGRKHWRQPISWPSAYEGNSHCYLVFDQVKTQSAPHG